MNDSLPLDVRIVNTSHGRMPKNLVKTFRDAQEADQRLTEEVARLTKDLDKKYAEAKQVLEAQKKRIQVEQAEHQKYRKTLNVQCVAGIFGLLICIIALGIGVFMPWPCLIGIWLICILVMGVWFILVVKQLKKIDRSIPKKILEIPSLQMVNDRSPIQDVQTYFWYWYTDDHECPVYEKYWNWEEELRSFPSDPKYAHFGVFGELEMIEKISGGMNYVVDGLGEYENRILIIHGALLHKSLDGDVILVAHNGVFLLECKHWKAHFFHFDGQWQISRLREDNENDDVNEEDFKASPSDQYRREHQALVAILRNWEPVKSLGDPEDWVRGGLVFTHPHATWRIHHDDFNFGGPSQWAEKIIWSRLGDGEWISQEQRLEIVDCILDHASKLGDFPGGEVDMASEVTQFLQRRIQFYQDKQKPFQQQLQKELSCLEDYIETVSGN